MPHLGTQPPTGFKTTTKQSFSGDNSTVAFTLNRASSTATDLEIFVDNIQQEPTTAYSVSGTTLTFTEAPPTGTNNVYVVNRGGDQNGLLPPQDLGTTDYIFGDDISFNSDGAVINFGADSDINLTHVADTGLTTNNDFSLKSDSSVLKFGNDEEITVTHVADTGLNFKHTATGDDKPIILTLQTGETDIAADDVIGTINFQAPDEGTGTDAILVAAGISAISEGDFSSSSNATALVFKTGSSEAATEKARFDSSGNLSLGNGTATNDGAIHINAGSSAKNIVLEGDRASLGQGIGNLQFHSAGNNVAQVSGQRGSGDDAGQLQFYTATGGTLSSALIIDESGHITKPLQPAFSVTNTGSAQSLTAGSTSQVTFDSERFDINGDFGSNQFTAPVTGKYYLSINMAFQNMDTGATSYLIDIFTSNRRYLKFFAMGLYGGSDNSHGFSLSILADMDANDIAKAQVAQNGGSNQTTLNNDAEFLHFTGYLVC